MLIQPTGREVVLRSIAPPAEGLVLVALTHVFENVPGMASYFGRQAGMFNLRKLDLTAMPVSEPICAGNVHYARQTEVEDVVSAVKSFPVDPKPTTFTSYKQYHEAYVSKQTTPVKVMEHLLAMVDKAQQAKTRPLNALKPIDRADVLRQAKESTERYEAGRSLSVMDGVPVVFKDEVDVAGHESNRGTSFIGAGKKVTKDAEVVRRFRSCGAIIVGKTIMHELGWDSTSINPHFGTPSNPYNPYHSAGGSSGGSSAAVCAGLVPIANTLKLLRIVRIEGDLWSNLDGWIRYGFAVIVQKMQWSLMRCLVDCACFTTSVLGPIACSANDMILGYRIMAGRDPEDESTWIQPPVSLATVHQTRDLSDVTIGVFSDWIAQVQNPDILPLMEKFMEALQARGATFVEIEIPDLEQARIAHAILFSSELYCGMLPFGAEGRRKLTYPNRILMRMFDEIKHEDIVRSNQIRGVMIRHLRRLFRPEGTSKKIDFIITPTTAITAPP
ncbi:hypothetical protein BZG36_03997, partial [Bifiguratus adelaidae]